MAGTKSKALTGVIEELLSTLPDNLRKAFSEHADNNGGKLSEAALKQLKTLAESRQFSNRGLNVVDDLSSNMVAPGGAAGMGVGGIGGFVAAPGTESENMMGKKTYTGPSLSDRIQYGIGGALAGGSVGAGIGMKNMDTLAKQVAKGRDLPPGAVMDFLQTIDPKQRKAVLLNAAAKTSPDLARQLRATNPGKRVNKGGKHVAAWADGLGARKIEIENDIRQLMLRRDRLHRTTNFMSPELSAVERALTVATGGNTPLNELTDAHVAQAAGTIAKYEENAYKASRYMIGNEGMNAQLKATRGAAANGLEDAAEGYSDKMKAPLSAIGASGGMAGGALLGSAIMPGAGTAIGGILGGLSGGLGGHALSDAMGGGVAKMVQKYNPAEMPGYTEALVEALKNVDPDVAKHLNLPKGMKGRRKDLLNRTPLSRVQTDRSLIEPDIALTNRGREIRNLAGLGTAGLGAVGLASYLGKGGGSPEVEGLTNADLGTRKKTDAPKTVGELDNTDLNKGPINVENPILQHFNNKNYTDLNKGPINVGPINVKTPEKEGVPFDFGNTTLPPIYHKPADFGNTTLPPLDYRLAVKKYLNGKSHPSRYDRPLELY